MRSFSDVASIVGQGLDEAGTEDCLQILTFHPVKHGELLTAMSEAGRYIVATTLSILSVLESFRP
jgi:hypothetical protein